MKFSELTPDQWASLQPYLDTAVLPVTGLAGSEMPFEATEALESLRDVLDVLEIPFKGRIVTYPACHYCQWDEPGAKQIDNLCTSLKEAGFRHVIVVTAFPVAAEEAVKSSADLVIGMTAAGEPPTAEEVSRQVRELWLTK
ncbi:DUF2487 family protein [Paenibacillus sp. GCM10027626]|uniref:DUF2487 family protein n=1 Tax=Paenibacillus sp. GCM10027626 TaxID=3273411 RepID=UPI00363619FB